MSEDQKSIFDYMQKKGTLPNADAQLLADAKKKEVARIAREAERAKNAEARKQLAENPPDLPEGQYRVVVMDPPWDIKKIPREVAPNQVDMDYPTLSVEEISAIDLPLADDAWFFMWTTQKYLPISIDMLKSWDLTYRFVMVWHKPGGFQVFNYPQFNCEFIVCGSKGNPQYRDSKAFNTAFHAGRSGHSIKPSEFYKLIRRVTVGPRLDMFSRRRINGFDSWGNEVDGGEPEPDQLSILEDF